MSVINAVKLTAGLKLAEEQAARVMRGIAFTLFTGTSRDTPVDTGRLRSNWQLTLNDPASSEVGGIQPNPAPVLSSYTIQDTIYLSNNLVYADTIENGRLNRTPNFMLKRNLAKINNELVRQTSIHRI